MKVHGLPAPRGVRIAGTGSFVPEGVLTNDDLARMVDTSDEWILQRTGIRRRHICDPSEEGTLHAWDLVEGKQLLKKQVHSGPVVALSCHPKSSAVLTASHDGTAKLWVAESATMR